MQFRDNRIISALRLLKQAFGSYKRQIIILGILGFVSGLLEGVGVNAIIPLFSLISNGAYQGTDIISRGIKDFITFLHLQYNFTVLALFITFLFIFKALLLFLGNYLNAKITANYERQMRRELLEETLADSWSYLLTQKIGHLEKVLMGHIGYASQALMELSSSILLISGLIMYIVVAVNISVIITLLTLALGGILFLFFKPFLYKTRVASEELGNIGLDSAHFLNEHIIGIKTVKAMSVESQVMSKAEYFFEILKQARIKLSTQENLTNAFLQPISIIFILLVFAFSYKTPSFNLASFAVILYLIQRMFTYIQNAQGKLHALVGFVPYLRSVVNFKEAAKRNRETNLGTNSFNFRDRLEFRNVKFFYDSQKGDVLNGINFSVDFGEMVGLIGSSGAGKTTIVDLLLRLFNPISGQILIDSQNINEIDLKDWRKNVAYVSQDIFLLNDTIENNVRFYDDSVSQTTLETVTKMANIYEFVQQQPQKWQTVVGERGIMLSAGQRQRIILARALARNPKILILDEATSALDNESEVLVQKAIENLKGKLTVLVIAHRLSTVINSDRLLILENGQITETGKPEKLLKDKESYFYKVYNIRENIKV